MHLSWLKNVKPIVHLSLVEECGPVKWSRGIFFAGDDMAKSAGGKTIATGCAKSENGRSAEKPRTHKICDIKNF